MTLKLGLLTSIGQTLDAFFPEMVRRWTEDNIAVYPAAGSPAHKVAGTTVIESLTRSPHPANLTAPRDLRRWAQHNDLDVILSNTANASALVRLTDIGPSIVYFCHGLHWNAPTIRTAPFRAAEAIFLRRTSGIITLNSDDEHWFHARTDVPQMRLQYGVGLDIAVYARTAPPPKGDRLELLWIGEFSNRKNPLAALDVAGTLSRLGVDFHLNMLGDGALRSTARYEAVKRGLDGQVSMPGKSVPTPFLNRAHAVIHTAHWEGLPRVLLEAIAVGRPVYGFDVKGVRDIPGIHLAPYGDSEGLASKVLQDYQTDKKPQLPPLDELSSVSAADMISGFVRQVATGPSTPKARS